MLFRDITVGDFNRPITDCELVLEIGFYRLYFTAIGEGLKGFYACAVELCESDSSDIDAWKSKNITVTPLFNITAYYDGVRHLEFNRECKESPGYIYCPEISGIIELLKKVRELELELCDIC